MPKSVYNILKFIKYLWWSLCCNCAAVFWELIPLHPSLCCVHTILRQPKPGAPPRFIINRGPWGKHQKFMIPNRGIWHIRHVEFIIRCDDIHALHIIFVILSDFFCLFCRFDFVNSQPYFTYMPWNDNSLKAKYWIQYSWILGQIKGGICSIQPAGRTLNQWINSRFRAQFKDKIQCQQAHIHILIFILIKHVNHIVETHNSQFKGTIQ